MIDQNPVIANFCIFVSTFTSLISTDLKFLYIIESLCNIGLLKVVKISLGFVSREWNNLPLGIIAATDSAKSFSSRLESR